MKRFFNNLAVSFQRFMQGRYGVDRLHRVLTWVYFAILIVSIFLSRSVDIKIYYAVMLAGLAVLIFAFFRVFSKNIEKRKKENERWLAFENKIKKRFRILRDRWKFRKTHVFKKCPKCKAVLRLKRIKGIHTVTCPHCKEAFKIRNF
ncbi:MAG: hypothetical protein J1E05_02765 [Eubacterium sp.]|nr:hypothetical protein [Eubacterium sp.]